MANYLSPTKKKLQKGSTYKNRGIIKWNQEQGFYVVGSRLNFVLPKNITDQLFSWTRWPSESGGLIFFELIKSPLRTLVAVDIVEISNVSLNPLYEYLPDREQVTKLIIERAQKRRLFLPAFFHIHPVFQEYSNIQRDFYRQAGPSQNDMASTFYTYPYLEDGKLSLPEFVICRHPTAHWIFVGYYDSIRPEVIDVQRNFIQQELGLGLIKETAPSLHSIKKKLKETNPLLIAGGLIFGYFAYKKYEPQIQEFMKNVSDIASAELNLKMIETQVAAFGQVPFYTIAKPGVGCLLTLPGKGYQKKITKATSQSRVTRKAIKELKKLLR